MPRSSCTPADYATSQRVVTLPHPPPVAGMVLVAALLQSETKRERERLGISLLEVLNDSFGLPSCGLTIADRAQTHGTDSSAALAQDLRVLPLPDPVNRSTAGALRHPYLPPHRHPQPSACPRGLHHHPSPRVDPPL